MTAVEVNFDGIVGPTHHYGGLGLGNLASAANAATPSNPREAARQGIAKMRALAGRGVPQAVLPPHERPHVGVLRTLGFTGPDAVVVAAAGRTDPGLLSAVSSASAMWAANAATVSPSPDTADGRLHLTPANLAGQLHRSIEAATTTRVLRAVFAASDGVLVHDPLPATSDLGDEGAANHGRIAADHGAPGVEFFVHGGEAAATRRFRARQSRRASAAVARRHRLDPDRVIVLAQAPEAIDAGVFHNDVIAVADRDLLISHERAFASTDAAARLSAAAAGVGVDLRHVVVPESVLPLADAVSSYLFNSQVVGTGDGRRLLVAPTDVEAIPTAAAATAFLLESGIDEVVLFDLRQSMRNGGGPACLRLRVVVEPEQRTAMHPGVILDEGLADRLEAWVDRHYRDHLLPGDLADPALLDEVRAALDDLTGILGLGSIYDFQR